MTTIMTNRSVVISKISPVLSILLVTACAGNKYKVKEVETEVQTQGTYQGAKIGLNENKEAVVQTETAADVELRQIAWKNYDLEQKIAAEHGLLTRCREEVADPRLGGSGQVTEIPDVDNMKTPANVKEELGITKGGNLSVIKKEMLVDRLESEKKYYDALSTAARTIEKHKSNCEREMGYNRVKHGLPAKRFQAVGSYVNGAYVQQRGPEHNLDDAFRIKSENESKAKATD